MSALGDALADQIAAGEVVERPASVVKELVDNAIDAGARRIDVRLTQGGTASIVVTDDGHGIHPEDLTLALQRHATSKLRRAEDLDTIDTLGFRGEALASIAAVARVRIASRRLGESVGRVVRCRPGGVLSIEPAGMAVGTRIEVLDLFANVPARRKFLRTEATEVGHVSEALVRLAIVHPQVRFSLTHGRRTLLELSPSDQASRICELLRRRGGTEPTRFVHCERDGVRVDAWLMTPSATTRRGGGVTVVVRRRVVREANIAKIVAASHTAGQAVSPSARLSPGTQPVACVWVEPPPEDVDINVHPQKVEIRFGDPQRVYAAVREAMASLQAEAQPAAVDSREDPGPSQQTPAASDLARPSLADALSGWTEGTPSRADTSPAPRSTASYRLHTRAASGGYSTARDELRAQARGLGEATARARALDTAPDVTPDVTADPALPATPPASAAVPEPAYLGCLPGPVGLFQAGEDLLAVDMRTLRSYLVYRRLTEDLGGEGISAQGLLQPAVVSLAAADVVLVAEHGNALGKLGLAVEPFGEEAVVVRAVPVQLRRCIDEVDAADLVQRVLPWLRMRAGSAAGDASAEAGMRVLASARGPDPAPRLARAWIRELLEQGEDLDSVDGIVRWTAASLTGRDQS